MTTRSEHTLIMLMECLSGNTGLDLNGSDAHGIPLKHKSSFYE